MPYARRVQAAIVYNPVSGKGRARELAAMYAAGLSAAGVRVVLCRSHGNEGPGDALFCEVARELSPEDAVLIAGGDGTVHRLLPDVLACGAAVCQLPAGTENLFAREFGRPRSPDAIARAMKKSQSRLADVGEIGAGIRTGPGVPFALMASTGPDAGIIHCLDSRRTGPISHMAYLKPILKELIEPELPLLSVTADGRPWVTRRGMLIVANSRQYAFRLDPCRVADPTDGLLDAVFLPGDSAADMARWAVSLLTTRSDELAPGVLHVRATAFAVRRHGESSPWQSDGEAAEQPPDPTYVRVRAGALRILICD